MPADPDDFFESKDRRPWSKIKDRILNSYMTPYIRKINKRGNPILLIDAFAGPGRTQTGEPGSPLIICQAAKKHAPGNYQAIFVNKEDEYHNRLSQILEKGEWTPEAQAILGDGQTILRSIVPLLTNQSVFLYIDPFGFDCEFETLRPFLERNSKYSTEILINLSAGFHRLAERSAIIDGRADPERVAQNHDLLTRILGGDYWKEALLSNDDLDAKTREARVVEGYKRMLASTGYLTYTGSCPVQKSRDSQTKYYMICASPHPDSLILFNDAMCNAFNEYMTTEETKDTLFADLNWADWRNTNELENIVVEYTNKFPHTTRLNLWVEIIRDHFMRFAEKEYRQAVNEVVESKKIVCTTPIGSPIRKTKRLNDDCVLAPAPSTQERPV